MKYEYETLKVGDADAIIIRHYINDETPVVILIDAGNESQGAQIKKHLRKYYGTTTIDVAICTHPDNDHKGGFFTLLQDDDVHIHQFLLTDPAEYLTEEDIKRYRNKENAKIAVRKIWDNSSNTHNLIDLILEKGIKMHNAIDGFYYEGIPIKVVGPTCEYYQEIVIEMVKEIGVDTYDDSSKDAYDDAFEIDDNEIKSVIDSEEDLSSKNASSLIVLYHPGDKKYLFCGDANTTSIQMMLNKYSNIRNVDMLKVPHHGSWRNLNTSIIKELAPKKSYISAAGNANHPNGRLVYWLSKYGPVFSTHKANGFIHSGVGINRENTQRLEPLRKKQGS